jgi:GntR family transcriptional regulator / MocR family aminotransferase
MRRSAVIWLNRSSDESLQNQLARQLKERIQQGIMKGGEPLPSTRELADQLKISRNTVVYAYDRLMGEGYLESRIRSGTFVNSSIVDPPSSRTQLQPSNRRQATTASQKVRAPRPQKLRLPSPFRPCQPDVTLFPIKIWNRMRSHVLRSHGSYLLHYQENCRLGLPALREALASYLRENRGVHCDWRQVAITTGSQQALFLLSRLLLKPQDHVYMEDPGYPGAQMAWKDAGAIVDPAFLDGEGIRLPEQGSPRYVLLYTTPSRQFPTGICLALPRRLALLDYAAKSGTWIVEDDYDSEFRYSAPPLPSLQSLDLSGRVIYVGTFSKVLFPSLRLGYVVLPPELVDDFEEMRALTDDHGPLIDQSTLAMFLEGGAFHSHIRRCRRVYAERQGVFLDRVRHNGLPLDFRNLDGGMNLTCFLDPTADDRHWSGTCQSLGLDVPPSRDTRSNPHSRVWSSALLPSSPGKFSIRSIASSQLCVHGRPDRSRRRVCTEAARQISNSTLEELGRAEQDQDTSL